MQPPQKLELEAIGLRVVLNRGIRWDQVDTRSGALAIADQFGMPL
ncbi:hypothetical protein [Oscillatoria acuminata]|nr:hypothetical protein [Oscillatoria acuminata]